MSLFHFSGCAAIGLAFSLGAHAQTTWYVDVDAIPPGTGAAATPYTSIQYALDQPMTFSGDTILVEDGVYRESLDYRGKTLAIRSVHGPTRTILEAQSGVAVEMDGDNLEWNLLDGFWLRGNGQPIGVYGVFGSVAVLEHCIVSGFDIGFFVEYNAIVERSTFVQNGQAFELGTVSIAVADNSIFWDNPGGIGCDGVQTIFADYCDGIDAQCLPGTGNFFEDPLFWDAGGGDFALRPGSPCIDRGDPAAAPDPDGSRADVGALAFDPDYLPEPSSYCTGKTNSLGCVARIGADGRASATSAAPFSVRADDVVPDKLGLLFYGHDAWALPWKGGYHCVLPPTRRTPPQVAGSAGGQPCTGTYAIDFNARIQSGVDPALVPGAAVYCQYWHRDSQDPTGFATGLTDALRFSVAP